MCLAPSIQIGRPRLVGRARLTRLQQPAGPDLDPPRRVHLRGGTSLFLSPTCDFLAASLLWQARVVPTMSVCGSTYLSKTTSNYIDKPPPASGALATSVTPLTAAQPLRSDLRAGVFFWDSVDTRSLPSLAVRSSKENAPDLETPIGPCALCCRASVSPHRGRANFCPALQRASSLPRAGRFFLLTRPKEVRRKRLKV